VRFRLALAIAFAVPLAACQTIGTTAPSQADLAGKKARIAANDFYTHASAAGADLVRGGLLDKAAYQRADSQAYSVLLQVRAGQATFQQLVAAAAALTGGQK
jgi:hypothetical protein